MRDRNWAYSSAELLQSIWPDTLVNFTRSPVELDVTRLSPYLYPALARFSFADITV